MPIDPQLLTISPTSTPTDTPTATETATNTPTPTSTPTNIPTATSTPTPTIPGAPTLVSPPNNSLTNVSAPTFTWSAAVGGYVYQIQLDDDRRFRSPEQDATLPAGVLSYTANPLLDGRYFWRVRALNRAGVAGPWSSRWSFTIDTVAPGAPVLRLPRDQDNTPDTTPRFDWLRAPGADQYRLQVSSEPLFTTTLIDVYVSRSGYTLPAANALAYGVYHWRVQAGDAAGNWSAWSAPYAFTVTILRAPADGSATTDTTPRFLWYAVTGAVRYQLQVDDNADFSSPIVGYTGAANRYTPTTPLPAGSYSWRVRVDTGAGFGGWTPAWLLSVTSSVSPAVAPLQAQAVEPTPMSAATATPSVTPTVALVESLQIIEAENEAVQRTGSWTAQATNRASAGYYIYSSGSPNDALTLTFAGTQVAVIYVQHPALGVFAVEVDGVLMQTVSSVAAESVFGARAAIAGLGASVHTLRVYPLSGTIAIDAFAVEPQPTILNTPPVVATSTETSTSTPPDTPTVTETATSTDTPTATGTATGTLTAPPTGVATATPIPTATPMIVTPTDTPLPVVLPWVETFDTGLGWTPSGAWRSDVQGAYRGAGWFAESTWRNQVSTLTHDTMVDLRLALNPTLSFWQKAVLSAGDAVAVDVSLDGGMSWMALDQQVGLSTEWTQRLLDLAAYRGQVIRLRFRLDTLGELPEGATTVGVWIDELLIQDVPPTPTWTPQPTTTPWPTATDVPSATPTPTETYTPSPMPSLTPTPTATPTPSATPTSTSTPTPPPVPTPTEARSSSYG